MAWHEGQVCKYQTSENLFIWIDIFTYTFSLIQEWEGKAAKLKDEYTKAVQEFEKNGGDKSSGGGKKRTKAAAKKPAKKSKKKDSDDDDEEEESD